MRRKKVCGLTPLPRPPWEKPEEEEEEKEEEEEEEEEEELRSVCR
jgi:hypothetical protein